MDGPMPLGSSTQTERRPGAMDGPMPLGSSTRLPHRQREDLGLWTGPCCWSPPLGYHTEASTARLTWSPPVSIHFLPSSGSMFETKLNQRDFFFVSLLFHAFWKGLQVNVNPCSVWWMSGTCTDIDEAFCSGRVIYGCILHLSAEEDIKNPMMHCMAGVGGKGVRGSLPTSLKWTLADCLSSLTRPTASPCPLTQYKTSFLYMHQLGLMFPDVLRKAEPRNTATLWLQKPID